MESVKITFNVDEDFGSVTRIYDSKKNFWNILEELTNFLCDNDLNMLVGIPDTCYILKDNIEIPLIYEDELQKLTIKILLEALNSKELCINVRWNKTDEDQLLFLLNTYNMSNEYDSSNINDYTKYWEHRKVLDTETQRGEFLSDEIKKLIEYYDKFKFRNF